MTPTKSPASSQDSKTLVDLPQLLIKKQVKRGSLADALVWVLCTAMNFTLRLSFCKVFYMSRPSEGSEPHSSDRFLPRHKGV